jgi:hypothetical protein
MNTSKILIAILTISLAGTAAYGQGTPAELHGPVRPPERIDLSLINHPVWVVRDSRDLNSPLDFNKKLAEKLKTLLPQGGDPYVASRGFEKLKEFVTTVRAANNLNLPFWELKSKMANGSSKELRKAIHALKPDADPKAEEKKANEQAKQDIKDSKRS